jgi:anti-sigma B factor antagonist
MAQASTVQTVGGPPEARFVVAGVLDATTAARVRERLDAALAEAGDHLCVDLSDLRLIDCAGVGVLVCLYKRARDRGASVTFAGLCDQPRVVLAQLGLDRLFGG